MPLTASVRDLIVKYTQEQLDTYYYDNEDSYDYIEYIYYYASGSADEEAGIDEETAMATAQDTADQISQLASDETSFIGAVQDVTGEEVSSTRTQGSSLSSIYSEFLLSSDRSYGDCEVFSSDYGYYVVMYLGRDDNHYNTVSARHILIKAEADEEGNYTDEAKEAALARIEEIYAEWQEGEATENSFAELANTYSDDGGSNTNGGLYEGIYKGQMVTEFNDFCFDESRQPGDTGIVYGESSSYAGYHVMYYVGEGELYSNVLAENSLLQKTVEEWLNSSDITAVPGAEEVLVDPVTAPIAAEEPEQTEG